MDIIIVLIAIGLWIILKFYKLSNNNKQENYTGVSHKDLTNKTSRPSDQSKYKTKKSTITPDKELTTLTIDISFNNKPITSRYSANIIESSISAPTKNQIKTESNKCWIPKEKSITVAGIKIDSGMLYVGSKLQSQSAYYGQANCLINPRLKVSNNSNSYHDGEMPYWPSYSDISPQHRRKYLEWLADGAKDPDIDTGYVFLYFYGLERRLLLDQSIEDAVDISCEIKRLLSIYSNNHSINNYLSKALSCANILFQKEQPTPTVKINDSYNSEIPLYIRIYLGKKLQNDPILNIDDLLIWFFNHPATILRTPATRLDKEFIALMKIRLIEKHPDGLKVRIPKKKISIIYTASSNNFTVDLSSYIDDVVDISRITAPIREIQNIANSVTDELDKLSRLLGRNPKAIGTYKALALLPPELTKEFGGDRFNKIQLWISEKHQSQNGVSLLELVKIITDHSGAKITKTIYKEVEQVATNLGCNVIPAHNEIIGSITPDMQILLLPKDNDSRAIESPSQEFLLALFELTLGAYIAQADHHVSLKELEILSKRIEDLSHLNKREHNRLYLHIKWLTIQKVELLTLKNSLKNLNKDSKMAFADIAIAVAATDGQIIPQNVKALETVYQSMGLDKKELFSSLHSMTKPGVHKSIDKTNKPLFGGVNRLNMERIDSTLHDTAKAATLLASIFEDDEIVPEPEPEPEPEKINENIDKNTINAGLDKVHTQLLNELLNKDEWSRDEYQKLASSLKLLPDGAIEVINERAFEVYDEIIIENDDPLIIYKELLNKGV